MIQLGEKDPYDGTLRDLAPDLTPMLDILFILLVFFMLTMGTQFQSLDLTLPSGVAEELVAVNEAKNVTLEIHKTGYVIDGKKIDDFEELKKRMPNVIEAKPEHELIVAGDKDILVERFLKVLTYLRSQGIEAANILIQNEDDNK